MTTLREEFRDAYATAFHEYVTGAAGEHGLERAYELGRTAVGQEMSTLDLAAIHHEALAEALALATSAEEHARVARAATEFAMESLSTFEMAQRGFREAQEAARLEQRHSDQLRGLADAALAIAASRSEEEITALVTRYALDIIGAGQAGTTMLPSRVSTRVRQTIAEGDQPIRRVERPDMPPLHQAVCDAGELFRLNGPELEAHPAWSREDPPAGTGSWLAVPLVGRTGEAVGLVHLSDSRAGAFSANDEAILVQLAQIASVAIENARLYSHEHEISQTLQRSLLPPHMPEIPGVAVSARFRPAGEGDEVGGDFYDIFEIGGGRWGIAIGDVCGKGAAAATVTALARYTLRATAIHESEPERILGVLNEALLRNQPDQRFCTLTYATLEPRSRRLELVRGGHPPPLLLRDGAVEPLGSSGTILGIMEDPPLEPHEVSLRPGDTVVFYTDGVTDAHAPEHLLKQEEFEAALGECQGLSPPEVAARIEALALQGVETPPRDDIAILVVALEDGARSRHVEVGGDVDLSMELPPAPESAGAAREALAPLGERLPNELLESIRLLVTELITNSVKHGRTDERQVGVTVTLSPEVLRVEVTDGGNGFEPPPPPTDPAHNPSGWGLYLVDRIADRWGVEDADGTLVWFEIDRV